jgi:hypothetical protein
MLTVVGWHPHAPHKMTPAIHNEHPVSLNQ